MSTQVPNPPSNVLSFPSKSSPSNAELIPFAGGVLEALRSGGQGWLSIKAACEAMGIDHRGQKQRLDRAPWATGCVMHLVDEATDGKQREMFCLRIEKVGMWLATIETSRIADPAARAKIELWQCEAADVLDRWWRGAAFVRPAEVIPSPVDSLGRLEEWVKMRRAQEVHGEALDILRSDSARLGSELAAQREALELLDKRLHRNMPTKEEREELVRQIEAACKCRISDRDRAILKHVALDGPATSIRRMAAAAGLTQGLGRAAIEKLGERALLDVDQRDPVIERLKNYFVIADGLHGHADGCQKFALESLDNMMRLTDDTAVHVVPPALGPNLETVPPSVPGHIPLPQVQPQLALDGIERTAANVDLPQGMTSRQRINKRVRGYAIENAMSYSDVFAMLFAECAQHGIQLKGHVHKGVAEKPLDYAERKGITGHVYEIAEQFLPLQAVERPSDNRAVH